ncbi:FxLYD domain-containing protein [Streptomyces sp. NPDC058657]|uniref:FxLYD domain-containing protein n=1 Tax=unclassified Streptomyces TaxID=2593676 RepID=UPI003668F9A0
MANKQPPPGWSQPPPEGYPQQGGQGWVPPPPPRKSGTGKIIGFSCLGAILLVAILVAAVMVVAVGGDDEPVRKPSPTGPAERPQENGPRGDVRITSCEVDSSTRWPHADLVVTNRSSKDSDYTVHVEFVDASGKRLSETHTSTSRVAPGQQSEVTAQSLDPVKSKITCRIKEVTRFAS